MPERKQIFDLRSIGTQRIRKNQAWAEQFQKKHQYFDIFFKNKQTYSKRI